MMSSILFDNSYISNFITREEFEAVIGQLRNAAAPV